MLKHALAALAALGIGCGAEAATVMFAPGSGGLAAGETLVADFNLAASDGLVSGTNFRFLTGTSSVGALPAAGDGSRYLSVLGGGRATFHFDQALSGFSLDIGSVDSYNSIRLTFTDGRTQLFTGSNLVAIPDGNQLLDRTNGRFSFATAGDERIARLDFLSGNNAFEVDNLAANFVPEPQTWALMILGFGFVGYALRRRRAPGAAKTVTN